MIPKGMQHTKLIVILLVLLTSAELVWAQGDAGQPGEFLRHGVGGRALGLGRAFVAIANDANAIYWNPGGLIAAYRKEFTSMYTNLFYDSRYSYVAIALPRPFFEPHNKILRFLFGSESAWGVGWVRLSTFDFDQRNEANVSVGNFDIYQQAILVSFAHEWVRTSGIWNVGVNYKMVSQGYSGLVQNTNSGIQGFHPAWDYFGLDVGVTFQPLHAPFLREIPGLGSLRNLQFLRLGAIFQNFIPPSLNQGGVNEIYPAVFRIGWSYLFRFPKDWRLLVVNDYETLFKPRPHKYDVWRWDLNRDRRWGVYWGIELQKRMKDFLLLPRLGFNNRAENWTDSFTYGFGMNCRVGINSILKLDFALLKPNESLGWDSRFFLTLEFGQPFDVNYFLERIKIHKKKSDLRKDYLHIVAQYPNDQIESSARALAEIYDPNNAPRYYRMIGGLGWANVLYQQAKKLHNEQKFSKAKEKAKLAVNEFSRVYRKSLKEFTDEKFLNYGESYMINEQWSKALEKIMDVQQPSLRYCYLSGVAYKRLRNLDKAIESFRCALEFKEEDSDLYRICLFHLAECLMEKGHYQDAIKYFALIIKSDQKLLRQNYPRYTIFSDRNILDDAYYNMSICYQELGQKRQAAVTLAKVARYYPNSDKIKGRWYDKKLDSLIR